jgi:hypothetical protein
MLRFRFRVLGVRQSKLAKMRAGLPVRFACHDCHAPQKTSIVSAAEYEFHVIFVGLRHQAVAAERAVRAKDNFSRGYHG